MTLGLFCSLTLAGGGCAPDPHAAAARYDARYATGAFTWLAEHAPSAVVAWHVDPALLRDVDPPARILGAAARPCAEAAHARAALVVLFGDPPDARIRDAALDCGFALFRDVHGAVIAPR